MRKNPKEEAKNEAREKLLSLLKPGDVVYTVLRHVSRSGMTRHISVIVPDYRDNRPDDRINDVTYLVARVLGDRTAKDGGLVVGGCGMDMGFSVVYNLGWALFPKGFKTWEGYWRNEPLAFETDGGYAFRHRWL